MVSNRIKYQVGSVGWPLIIGLLVLGLLLIAGAGVVYPTSPPTEERTFNVDVQTFETSVETSAVVTGTSTLYPQGEELQDQPVYFTNATPTLTLTAVTTVPENQAVTVSHRLVLSQGATFNGQPFWNRSRVEIGDGETTVQDGEFRSETTINVEDLVEETADIEEEANLAGALSNEFQLETTYETELEDGHTYDGTLTASTDFEFDGGVYWLEEDLAAETTESRQETEQVQLDRDFTFSGILALAGVVILGLAVGLWFKRPTQEELDRLEIQLTRQQYKEWISNGEFPTNPDKQYVYLDSLDDLVDVAIDTNKRVIYDTELDAYSVVDADLVYYHATDRTIIDTWLE